jgi:hypothetical protein
MKFWFYDIAPLLCSALRLFLKLEVLIFSMCTLWRFRFLTCSKEILRVFMAFIAKIFCYWYFLLEKNATSHIEKKMPLAHRIERKFVVFGNL